MKPFHRSYQPGYSELQPEATFDREKRRRKAEKILSVLEDHLGDVTRRKLLLDVGCSTGTATALAERSFGRSIGIDVDKKAIGYARVHNGGDKTAFMVADSMDLPLQDSSVDAVICSHVYEHVPDADKMMEEIERVLVPGGVCYFAAGNLFQIMEPHYRIPFLSLLPRPLGDYALRITGKGRRYYEKHRTFWGLKRLVGAFAVEDYTIRIVQDPERFNAVDMIKPGSLFHVAVKTMLRRFYWVCPTYIWLLVKPKESEADETHLG